MKILTLWLALLGLAGCTTTTTIDEYRSSNKQLTVATNDSVVLLGRRDAGHYETDAEFVDCVGNKLRSSQLQVIPEQAFMDALYPWLEPRTAPKGLMRMRQLMQEPLVGEAISSQSIRYFVWLDGSTETLDKGGSISCAAGPGGAGCFGFAKWDKASIYEAIVWDVSDYSEVARVRVDSEGTSYLIGAVAPIPLLTPVKSDACKSLGKQLQSLFVAD
ncbi:MAG: hypothetical protein OSA42_01525 [Porticoccaceae bacterium]|nr:hypothetical protein [Porticoccaceae bacterium]